MVVVSLSPYKRLTPFVVFKLKLLRLILFGKCFLEKLFRIPLLKSLIERVLEILLERYLECLLERFVETGA